MYRANPSYGHTHFRQSENCFLDAILTYIGNTNNANLFVNHATFRRCTCSDLNIYSVALYKKDLAMYVTPIIKKQVYYAQVYGFFRNGLVAFQNVQPYTDLELTIYPQAVPSDCRL